MKKISRLLAVLLVAMLVTTGCTGAGSSSSASSDTSSEVVAGSSGSTTSKESASEEAPPSDVNTDEHITLTMVNRVSLPYSLDDNPVLEKLQELNNVTLEIELPPVAEYKERVNIIMASGDLPDIIHLQSIDSNYRKYAADGMLLPMNDYLANSPNIESRLGDVTSPYYKTVTLQEDGQVYAVPRSHEASYYVSIFRQDWFDAAGVEKTPETPEELMAAGLKVKEVLGKPLFSLVPEEEALQQFQHAFGLHNLLDVSQEDGKVVITEGQEGYMKLMDFYREAYEAGILEAEWYLNKPYDDGEKFKQDKIGMLIQWKKAAELYGEAATSVKEAFPEATIGGMLPLKNAAGERYLAVEPSLWGAFAVSAETEHPDRVMSLIDWGHSDEGITLQAAGIQGVTYDTYDMSTGIVEFPEEMIDARSQYLSGFMQFITSQDGIRFVTAGNTPEERANISAFNKDFVDNVSIYNIDSISSAPGYSESRVELVDILSEKSTMVSKYITGEITREEFVDFIDNKFLPANEASMQILQDYVDANGGDLRTKVN